MDKPMHAMQLMGRKTRQEPAVAPTLSAAAETPGADGIAQAAAVAVAAAAELDLTEAMMITRSTLSSRK